MTRHVTPPTCDKRTNSPAPIVTRRQALQATMAAAFTGPVLPTILHATKKSGNAKAVVGKGAFRYECNHQWGNLPAAINWRTTHGVAVDKSGLIYIKQRGAGREATDTIIVFDGQGKFVRSFGKTFHRGGHGIDIRAEGKEEFLYLSDTRGSVAKLNLKGETVWQKKGKPPEPGIYKDKDRYSPTNVAFASDGGFFVGDGYGSNYIHRYDKNAKWIKTFGGTGKAPGKMRTCHGMWWDNRPGRQPGLVVADRANARLQYFSATGEHQGFVSGLSFPADIDIRGEVMLVPDLHARVSLYDKDNQLIDHLGYDPQWTKKALANRFEMRGKPKTWEDGRFVHPHDACFDAQGNIFVVEWVVTGRVTKLRRLS